jgi:putative ABC transport system substrate-binding protein
MLAVVHDPSVPMRLRLLAAQYALPFTEHPIAPRVARWEDRDPMDQVIIRIGGLGPITTAVERSGIEHSPQSGKVWRIVFFSVAAGPNPVADGFRRGLSELGYVEGSNLAVEYRWMGGHENQYDEVARQMAETQPDIIVTAGQVVTVAAKKATAQIPIVALGVNNPVSAGLAASIAHPAGNLTGFALEVTPETNAKMVELLHEAASKIIRIGVLWNSAIPDSRIYRDAAEQAARSLNVALHAYDVRRAEDIGCRVPRAARKR